MHAPNPAKPRAPTLQPKPPIERGPHPAANHGPPISKNVAGALSAACRSGLMFGAEPPDMAAAARRIVPCLAPPDTKHSICTTATVHSLPWWWWQPNHHFGQRVRARARPRRRGYPYGLGFLGLDCDAMVSITLVDKAGWGIIGF